MDFLLLFVTFWTAMYFYFTRNFNYWKERNVLFAPPIPFFGNIFPIFTMTKSIGDICRQIHESTTKPFIGFFVCDEPCLLVRDPELVRMILVKDFNLFINRTMTNNTKDDPMGSHILYLMKTPEWSDVRKKITPLFTTHKLKLMHKLMKDVGDEVVEYLNAEVPKDPIVDIREVSAKYTTETVSSTAFGINANCFKNENAELRIVSRRVYNWALLERGISTTCHFMAPTLVKLFKMRFVDKVSADILRTVFWSAIEEREKTKILRDDILDILIDIKNEEHIDDSCILEGDKLVAQATQFFIAGYETTSSVISFTLYEISVEQDVQDKLREEVLEVKSKYGGFSYEAIAKMEYLEMCVKETLRKYPSLPFLDRRCSVDYQIPGTDVVLTKGTAVFISNWALQMDPQYFPNPDKYDPTRFTEENMESRPQSAYLPFGEGPRHCIGARYAVLSAKTALAQVISEYEVSLCDETQHPMKLDPKGFLLAPILKLPLKFRKMP